jgi:hypothetical protein
MQIPHRLDGTPRLELLRNLSLIIWDEFFSNHREIMESLLQYLQGTKVIILCMGDVRQILPIEGDTINTIQSTFTSSALWPSFDISKLTVNMRLAKATATIDENTSEEDRASIEREILYAKTILAIGEGRDCKLPLPSFVHSMHTNFASYGIHAI